MVRALAILIFALTISPLHAQTVYLFTTKYTNVVNKIADLDAALGYPNVTNKTWTAISYDVATNGVGYAIVAVDIGAIWNCKTARYVDFQELVQNNLTVAQWGTNVVTTTNDLRVVCRISRALAKQLYFLSLQDTP